MGRAAVERTDKTSADQNASYFNESQNSYTQAQNAEGDYQDQLAKYASSNPYVQGGQFQTQTNKVLANTADAGAQAAGAQIQGQAERTGQNTAGGIAATEHMQQQNTRNLSGEEAEANQQRIGADAGYNKGVLGATEFPAQFASEMAKNMSGQANSSLDTMAKAAAIQDPAANAWNQAAAGAAEHFANDESDSATDDGSDS